MQILGVPDVKMDFLVTNARHAALKQMLLQQMVRVLPPSPFAPGVHSTAVGEIQSPSVAELLALVQRLEQQRQASEQAPKRKK